MRRTRVAAALVVVVCAVIAGVVANRWEAPVGADNVASSDAALGANSSGGAADSGGQMGLSAGNAETGGEDSGEASGTTTVPEMAANLVREYEQRGDCVLVRSGYLDLSGRVWSMVVEGSGWVEVCIVQRADDGACETKVMHMDAAEWAASLGELGLAG